MIPESPQGFVVATETRKAAVDNGYRIAGDVTDGWARWTSTTAHGAIHLAAAGPQGPWFLALEHLGVVAELGLSPAALPGPGRARYAFATTAELHRTLTRVYRLAVSLPEAPLEVFRTRTRALPRTTEAERLVVQRVGQDIFRDALMEYWGGRCPLTGIAEAALLRASHIRPWSECASDEERLDVHNGLLLSALWDAAFDRHLVSFEDDGMLILSASLGAAAIRALAPEGKRIAGLVEGHRPFLLQHRAAVARKV